MGADKNLAVVQEIYEAFGRGDVETIMGHLAEEVDFGSEPAATIAAPWHGRRRKAEVPAFFAAIGEAMEVTEFTPLSFATNDTDVMVVIRFGISIRATGRSGVMDLHHWWRLRDGKVVLYRGTEDTALTERLLADG